MPAGCRNCNDGVVTGGGRGNGPRVSWFELFYDLVVVALVLHGSDLFEEAPSFGTGAWLAVTLMILLVLWLSTTLTFNTTRRDWTLRRILALVQMMALVVASLSISRDSGLGDGTGFLALSVAFASIAVLYWIKRSEAMGRRSSSVMAIAMGAASIICVGGAIAGDSSGPGGISWAAVALALALVIVVAPLMTVLLGDLVASGQLDRDHLSERVGQLVLIALGESFADLVLSLGDLDEIPNPVYLVLTFAVVYAIWSIYFRTVLPAGLPEGAGRTRAWIGTHYLLIFGAIGTADGFSALTVVPLQEGSVGLESIRLPLPLLYVIVAFALLALISRAVDRRLLRVHAVAAAFLILTIGAGIVGLSGQAVVMGVIGGAVVIGDAAVVGVMSRTSAHGDQRARRDSNPQPTG